MDQELATIVGQRVRRLRTQAGHSLRRQAELSRVSASALSALENGRGGMSIAALQRVGAFFDLTICDLLDVPEDSVRTGSRPRIEVFCPGDAVAHTVERGSGVAYQVLGRGPGHALAPYVISFAPGSGYDADRIAHPGEEFTYVVFGEVELFHGDERRPVRQGEAVRFDTDIPHAFANPSASLAAVIVGTATPPW